MSLNQGPVRDGHAWARRVQSFFAVARHTRTNFHGLAGTALDTAVQLV